MKIFLILSILLSCLFLFNNCYRKIYQLESNHIQDGKYDSEFPSLPCSQELEDIAQSVKLVSILAFYESYDLPENSKIKKSTLTANTLKNEAIKKHIIEKPAAGTATVIYHRQKRIALLTCAHIIYCPDTVITYFKNEQGKETEYIQNISIKFKQYNTIGGLPQVFDFNILAMDLESDVAIIGKELSSIPKKHIPVFNYPTGKAEELNWGTFVYLFGYPKGQKMISTGIVSSPNRDKKHSFLTNASFNRGFSGGLVLAVRDGAPNFELVGMTNSVSAESHFLLSPDKDYDISDYNIKRPYTGDVFTKYHRTIFYGITFAISIETINNFIKKNKPLLQEKGYDVNHFFDGK